MIMIMHTFKTLSNVPTWDMLKMACNSMWKPNSLSQDLFNIVNYENETGTKQLGMGMHPCIKYVSLFEIVSIVSRETMASDTLTLAINKKKLAISSV